MPDTFWTAVREQLAELRAAATADDVIRILSHERNPYGSVEGAGDGYFAGSGGDDTVWDALDDAGWSQVWSQAAYFYVMQAPDGSKVTYIEGDIYRGDKRS